MIPFLDLTAAYRELKPEIDAAVAPSPRLPHDPRFVIAQRSAAIHPRHASTQRVVGLDNFATGHRRNLDEVQTLVSP